LVTLQFHFLKHTFKGSRGCPARCEFCDLADQSYQSHELITPKPFKQNNWIQPWVLIRGGDQYQIPDLNERVLSLQKHGYKVAITTSGLLLKDRSTEDFVVADLTFIPVFSHEPVQHNYWMGVDSLSRLLEIGKALQLKKKLVVFAQLISRESVLVLDDVSDFWKAQGLFCVLRNRSALIDVPGMQRETRAMLQYQARKPHMERNWGDAVDLVLKSCPFSMPPFKHGA
jgi:MoaA/NifB/PqqE/SkfB family radical SAM enzyme